MIFGTFNGLALIHVSVVPSLMKPSMITYCLQMFLFAQETKNKTLEEMDEVFDSGIPAWKSRTTVSRLDQLTRDIEKGDVKVQTRGAQATEGQVVETKA